MLNRRASGGWQPLISDEALISSLIGLSEQCPETLPFWIHLIPASFFFRQKSERKSGSFLEETPHQGQECVSPSDCISAACCNFVPLSSECVQLSFQIENNSISQPINRWVENVRRNACVRRSFVGRGGVVWRGTFWLTSSCRSSSGRRH